MWNNSLVVPGSVFFFLCTFDMIVSAFFLKAFLLTVLSPCRLCPYSWHYSFHLYFLACLYFKHLNLLVKLIADCWHCRKLCLQTLLVFPHPPDYTSVWFLEGTKLHFAFWILHVVFHPSTQNAVLAECCISLLHFTQILKMLPPSEDLFASTFIEVPALRSRSCHLLSCCFLWFHAIFL